MRSHMIDKTNNNPAYHLAVGSAGTAVDLAALHEEPLKGELMRLAENFLNIADHLVAAKAKEMTPEEADAAYDAAADDLCNRCGCTDCDGYCDCPNPT